MRYTLRWIIIIFLFVISAPNNSSYALEKEFKSSIIYEVDGKEVLKGREVISINKNIYLLVEDIEEALDFKIDIKDNTIKIRSKEEIINVEDSQIFYVEEAKVADVDMGQKRLTILPYSNTQDIRAYITLNINEETQIFYEKIDKLVPINMIEKDMMISAKYILTEESNESEKYIATQVIIKGNQALGNEEIPLIKEIEIIEVNFQKGYIKAAYSNKDKKKIENQIIVHVDQNTNIRDVNNTIYTVEDLKIGQKIKVITNGILTDSIPPQTLGLEIIIIQ